jgi:hypothetical protein
MYFCTYFSLCSSHIIWIHYLLVANGLSVIVYLYFIIFCFTAGAYININEMASANSSRKKRVGLADSQDNVNVGR